MCIRDSFILAQLGLQVFGDVDEHGALAPRTRDIERFADGVRKLFHVLDDVVVLCDCLLYTSRCV